jgi:PAS domain S-box-containing protein
LDAIFIADAGTGIIIDCNRAAEELVGRDRSELIGKHQKILHPPEEISGEFSRTFEQHIKEKADQVLETKVVTKSGEIKDVAIKASLFELKGKRAIQGLFRDVTESKRVIDELKESEEKYRNVVENVNETIFVAQDGRFKYVNRKVIDLLGYSPEELTEKLFFDYIHPDDRKMVAERHARRLKGEDLPGIYPFRIVDKAGKVKWVEINAVRIDWQGKPATLNFLTDITERKRAEEERDRHVAELEVLAEAATGRELRMMELENEVNALLEASRREPKYKAV